jgi:hypothetical protein
MVSLYRTFSVIPRTIIIIDGGIGFYRARMTQTNVIHLRLPLNAIDLHHTIFDVSGKRNGLHGGLALEYEFNYRFSILAEGRWRSAKIEHLTGRSSMLGQSWDQMGNPVWTDIGSKEGILYHLIGENLYTGREHEKLVLEDFPPPWFGVDLPHDIREAFLDLSGFTFKIGLRIKLF